MSCECHSSFNGETEQLICNNHNNLLNQTIKLKNQTKQIGQSFDTFHLTFYDKEITVYPMFINDLSYLFPRLLTIGKRKSTLKITLSFHNFQKLNFQDYSFYQLFGDKSDYTTKFSLELTSNGQVTFSPMAFNQIIVDQMYMHSSSLDPYSFEEIFNNTNIGELTIEGFTPRSNDTQKINFNGKIRSAKFTKMVEMVSNDEFPNYPVRSMIIEAHEARRINASSFINYRNLYGVHLIRPNFFFDNRSFDGFQFLTSLETIELDAETLKDHTFQHASRIRSLTLGQNTRRLTNHSLDHLDYLTRFDASKVTLDHLNPTSRCVLARYIEKQQKTNPSMIILPPQAEYCDCIHDFILTILDKKPDQSYSDKCSDNQQERCQLSECNIVKNFRLPLKKKIDHEQIVVSLDEGIIDTPYHLYPTEDDRTTTHRIPSYVHRHPAVDHSSHTDTQDSQTSALIANEPIDPNAIPTEDYDQNPDPSSITDNSEIKPKDRFNERRTAMDNERLKWIALILVCITVLCLLIVGLIIWFFTCRPTHRVNKAGFQPVLPNSSNV
ncbi:unnamed protein product [Adineta steineri]|uniref:Uncharacterized protein n=1 Tax=Adineta steineri TaxID=433720 RepID=A0A813MLW1_9BILA|nr:unnamed protein product [Adineta steineri]CAF0910387.1 unnamed protein product [Adineta steineri]